MLNKNLIKYQTNFSTQDEVFQEIASLAVSQGIATDGQAVIDGLIARENQSTTGFTDGFAIPHTKAEAIQEAGIVILVNENGIEWDSMDGKPARFFISLLIPENEAGTTHLSLLASISRMLVHDEVRTSLLEAKSVEEIYTIINRHLESESN